MAPIQVGSAPLSLFADLYELTMLQAYVEAGMIQRAVFSLFVRKLPTTRNYLLACGLETLLEQIERFRFGEEEIAYLASLRVFSKSFLKWLEEFRFNGDILALAEGTPFFANEPIVEIVASLPQAQLFETLVLNQVGMQTLLASKAVRVVEAAGGRPIIDFGSRRAQGVDAAVSGARAFYVAGLSATSLLAAGHAHGIPVSGTMAHSLIEAHFSETAAFEAFARSFPETVLLVDTYDTLAGVRRAAKLAKKLGPACKLRGIRLDFGDLLALSRASRDILDEAGLQRLQIIASGGLDEGRIAELVAAGAPIDAFGIGTDLSVSGDAPMLDIVYKLTEYDGIGRMKLSTNKITLPGRKQVFREFEGGRACRDVIASADESLPGTRLLQPVVIAGRRIVPRLALDAIRVNAKREIDSLPARLRSLDKAEPYPVGISHELTQTEHGARARIAEANADDC